MRSIENRMRLLRMVFKIGLSAARRLKPAFTGFSKILSACLRMAAVAFLMSGFALRMIVTAFGFAWRIAPTTIRPSPAPGMLRSVTTTSKLPLVMRINASITFDAVVTSNSWASRITFSPDRTDSSSSTSRILDRTKEKPPRAGCTQTNSTGKKAVERENQCNESIY